MDVRLLMLLLAFVPSLARAQNQIAATVSDDRGKPLADAVVIAVPADGNLRMPPKPRDEIVDQVDKEFLPKVQAVLVGTPVSFPNRDSVRHQVYSFSPAKKFELPLYSGVPQAVVFDKPGVVVLGCNIHDWMIGYVYVSESPYFAKTGADGKAVIADLPPREYVVRVWHPQLAAGEETTRKSVDASRARRADVAWSLALKPEAKIRRAPVSGQRGSY
jgi:plastocyanin